jgi:hypothetical protein
MISGVKRQPLGEQIDKRFAVDIQHQGGIGPIAGQM